MVSDITTARLVGCCVRGPKHEESNDPCQDAWYGYQLPNNRFIIAVGDGLGSAEYSHIGSEFATRKIADTLKQHLNSVDDIEQNRCKKAIREAVAETRSGLIEQANKHNESPERYNTTLLVTIGGPSGVAGAVVGDGGIVCEHNGDHTLLVPREMEITDTEYANVTVPLQSDMWEQSYRFGYHEEFDAVAVFSDGIDEFVWDGLDDVKSGFFEQVFNHAREISDTEEASQQLHSYLDNDHHRKYSSDDKTLAIGSLQFESDDLSDEESENNTTDDQEVGNGANESTADNSGNSKKDRKKANKKSNKKSKRNPETTKAVGSSSMIRAVDVLKKEKVETESGDQYEIAKKIDERQKSTVFRVKGRENLAVKIFNPEARMGDKLEQKVGGMVSNPPVESTVQGSLVQYAWPEAIIRGKDDQFLGYTMAYPNLESAQHALNYAKNEPHQTQNNQSGLLHRVMKRIWGSKNKFSNDPYHQALALSQAISELHEADMAVGELTHTNIRITEKTILLINCDDYHFKGGDHDFPSENIPQRYAPPEDYRETLKQTQTADQFGLAIHIFQLLMNGHHPFQADGELAVDGSIAEMITNQPFPYREPQPGQLEPPEKAPQYESIPPELRTLFETCFIEGKQHPEFRPSATEWVTALESIVKNS